MRSWPRSPSGRRDASLLDLRERLFGSASPASRPVPSCGEEIELTFNAAEVRREVGHGDGPSVVKAEGVDVTFRLPDTADLMQSMACPIVDGGARRAPRGDASPDGRDGAAIEPRMLPAGRPMRSSTRMSEIDPQADVSFDVACPSCAHAWLEPFDVVTFLWTELASWARGLLLDEVHQLASAYGWSEATSWAFAGAAERLSGDGAMSDFLTNLAARALGAPTLRPRLRSRFEPAPATSEIALESAPPRLSSGRVAACGCEL